MDVGTTFRELASRILSPDPQIFLAYDAQEAVQLVKYLGGRVTVVDLDVAGAEGLSLIQHVREKFPELPVVAVSRVLGVP
jgi:DNA-binding NarL/FixJ family response regulator